MTKHTTRPTCQACTRPVTDQAYLCGNCGDRIARYLGDIAALIDELAVTYTRRTSSDFIAFSRSAETALPWSEAPLGVGAQTSWLATMQRLYPRTKWVIAQRLVGPWTAVPEDTE